MAQIYQPQRKRDPLEAIAAGLQIAGSVLGIKEHFDKQELYKYQAQKAQIEAEEIAFEKARKAEGRLTTAEEMPFIGKIKDVPEGTPGSIKYISPTTGAPRFVIAADEKMTPYQSAQLGIQKDESDFKRNLETTKSSKEDKYKADDINKEFITNPRTNQYVSGFESSQELGHLLSKKQSVIDQIALRKIFKLSGDVGAIRSEDLEQLGTSPAWADRGSLIINKVLSGQVIDDKERAALNDFAKDMELNSQLKLNKHAETFANRISNTTSFNKQQALELMNPGNLLTPFQKRIVESKPQAQPGIGEAGANVEKDIDNVFNSVLGQ